MVVLITREWFKYWKDCATIKNCFIFKTNCSIAKNDGKTNIIVNNGSTTNSTVNNGGITGITVKNGQ